MIPPGKAESPNPGRASAPAASGADLIPVHHLLEHSGDEAASAYQEIVADSLAFAASNQGGDAFVSTRAMAAAHEAGHWVWLASHGRAREIRSVPHLARRAGRMGWPDRLPPSSDAIGPGTPVAECREFVELTLAGLAGEWLPGKVGSGRAWTSRRSHGSSAAGLAERTGADPRREFVEIMFDTHGPAKGQPPRSTPSPPIWPLLPARHGRGAAVGAGAAARPHGRVAVAGAGAARGMMQHMMKLTGARWIMARRIGKWIGQPRRRDRYDINADIGRKP